MDYAKPGFLIALLIGGCLVAALSFAQQAFTKDPEEPFRMRAVFRDFFIGAFLTSTAYMFLPESIDSIVSSGSDFFSAPLGGSGAGAGAGAAAATPADIELQTGPARF
jgi:hypothetical protein